MTELPGRSPLPLSVAVVDTQIISAILVGARRPREAGLLERYGVYLRGTSLVLSFASIAELRYGSLKGQWGPGRMRRMEEWFSQVATVVMPDNDLVSICADLRDSCRREGLGLSDKIHDSDRWIASTAIRYQLPLISDDAIFSKVPGLSLVQERPSPERGIESVALS